MIFSFKNSIKTFFMLCFMPFYKPISPKLLSKFGDFADQFRLFCVPVHKQELFNR